MERNRTASDYLSLFDADTGLLLIGGQAVNLWAEKYLHIEPALRAYMPFTSRDADFYKRSPKLRIPDNWKTIKIPSKGGMRLVTDAFEGPHGQTAEVLRAVNGLSREEIDDHSFPMSIAGRNMVFLSPVALFKAKLANLNSLDQKERQDEKHLRLLIIVNRCFFNELLTAYQGTERPKQAIKWLQEHVENIQDAAKQSYVEIADWNVFLPVVTLENHPSSAVRNFCEALLQS